MPAAVRARRVAAAPVAVAVQTKIGGSEVRLRAHTGMLLPASSTAV